MFNRFQCFRALAVCMLLGLIAFLDVAVTYSQDVKRGLGAGNGALANSVNSRWAYDWGYQQPNAYNGEYVPMFWAGGNLNTKINAIKGYTNTNYVLGFNEPERADQANMTVANAINQWATISNGFAGTGIKLVSPAVSDTADGRAWLNDFMAQVDGDANLVVDEIAFHWYGTVNINNPLGAANSFLNRVDQYHNTYNRNVWVTEFAGRDFGGNFTTEQMNDWNATFLEAAIAGLESRSHVTRYGWWNHHNDSRLVTKDSYGLWRPTKVGDHYSSTLLSGESRDIDGTGIGNDMVYLRGGTFVNDGADLGNAFGRLYAMSNHDDSVAASQFGGSGDWGMHSWGSVRVEENATLRKTGTNTVTWRNLDVYHDGTITLLGGTANAGTLWISGAGTNAQGTGNLNVNKNATLRLGNAADTAGFSLDYDIAYNGGTLTVDGVGITLNGNATVTQQSFFNINQDFVMNGNFIGNAPGIVKNGSATFTLNGDANYGGFTTINEGTLAINGDLNGNNVLVRDGGTLGGTGVIASDIIAFAGSTVSPGNSAGALSATDATFNGGSRLLIELKSTSEFDQLLLTGLMTVDSGAVLELNLLDGFAPTIGDEFQILEFDSFSGEFDSFVAPELAAGRWDFSLLGSSGIVRVTAVPEPSTTGMLLGSLALIGFRRRRRQ